MSQTTEALVVEPVTENILRARMREILTRSVNAIRGDPEPLHDHSWHDLPELIDQLKVDLLAALIDKENAATTITRLQGEAKVMLHLLALALDVLDTIDPDCATEHESLEELTDAIEAVLQAGLSQTNLRLICCLRRWRSCLVTTALIMNAKRQQAFAREVIEKVKEMKL